MAAPKTQIPECMAFEACTKLNKIKCFYCLQMPVYTWQKTVEKRIRKAELACLSEEGQ